MVASKEQIAKIAVVWMSALAMLGCSCHGGANAGGRDGGVETGSDGDEEKSECATIGEEDIPFSAVTIATVIEQQRELENEAVCVAGWFRCDYLLPWVDVWPEPLRSSFFIHDGEELPEMLGNGWAIGIHFVILYSETVDLWICEERSRVMVEGYVRRLYYSGPAIDYSEEPFLYLEVNKILGVE